LMVEPPPLIWWNQPCDDIVVDETTTSGDAIRCHITAASLFFFTPVVP